MKKLSKIRVIITVILLIIGANVLVYLRERSGKYISSIPKAMIDGYLEKMNRRADIWLLGNSTLDKGVLINELEKGLGKKIVKTPMGSGTMEAMSLLAIKAINESKDFPGSICLFVTKDDFNKNGYRAEKSVAYIKSMTQLNISEQILSKIPVYSFRLSLRNDLVKRIEKVRESKDGLTDTVSTVGNEYVLFKSSYLDKLGKDYEFNFNSVDDLAVLCRKKGISLYLFMPPVTHAIQSWQNYYYRKKNYEYVVASVEKMCKQDGIKFYNFSDSIPSTTDYFKDVYHLKGRGAAKFTSMLIPVLKKK